MCFPADVYDGNTASFGNSWEKEAYSSGRRRYLWLFLSGIKTKPDEWQLLTGQLLCERFADLLP